MVLLLSENEADCLIPQHRKQKHERYPMRLIGVPLPRERFSPVE